MVNITGGGLRNFLRLRKGLCYVIDDPVPPHPVFHLLQEWGGVETREMYQTFNMGMGYALVCGREDAESVVQEWPNASIVGRVDKGHGVLLEGENLRYENY
jgi:phosphoribosylformylglycinamidine cyclo-ligase